MSNPPSRYTDQQAALILKRAAELQHNETDKTSLAELEASAREVGIDATSVQRAAQELQAGALAEPQAGAVATHSQGRRMSEGLAGAPLRLHVERQLSAPPDSATVRRISDEIGVHLGDVVESHTGHAWRWRTDRSGGRDIRISVRERDGQLVLRVEERHASLAGGMFGGIVGGVGGGGMGLVIPLTLRFMPFLTPFAALLWVGLVFMMVRQAFRGVIESRHRELEELAQSIQLAVTTSELPAGPDEEP